MWVNDSFFYTEIYIFSINLKSRGRGLLGSVDFEELGIDKDTSSETFSPLLLKCLSHTFYFIRNECIFLHSVKNVHHYHHLNVILQRHHHLVQHSFQPSLHKDLDPHNA